MLIANNQLIKQSGIVPLEPLGDGQAFLPDLLLVDSGGRRTMGAKWAGRRGGAHLVPLDAGGLTQVAEIQVSLQMFTNGVDADPESHGTGQ
jgi:hypothetical protein